jgi:ribonuclease P protein component
MLDAGATFPRENRLLNPAQYRAVFSHPVKTTDNCFTVLCRSSGQATPRLGLAVAKKNSRLAVDRNRIKRIVRESFRNNKETLGGIDYVVLSRTGANCASNSELFASLERHWGKLRKKSAKQST